MNINRMGLNQSHNQTVSKCQPPKNIQVQKDIVSFSGKKNQNAPDAGPMLLVIAALAALSVHCFKGAKEAMTITQKVSNENSVSRVIDKAAEMDADFEKTDVKAALKDFFSVYKDPDPYKKNCN